MPRARARRHSYASRMQHLDRSHLPPPSSRSSARLPPPTSPTSPTSPLRRSVSVRALCGLFLVLVIMSLMLPSSSSCCMMFVVLAGALQLPTITADYGDQSAGLAILTSWQPPPPPHAWIRQLQHSKTIANCSITARCVPLREFCSIAHLALMGVCVSCSSPDASCGCTDSNVPQYNASATNYDGSCAYFKLCQDKGAGWKCFPDSAPNKCTRGQCGVEAYSQQKSRLALKESTKNIIMYSNFTKLKAQRDTAVRVCSGSSSLSSSSSTE